MATIPINNELVIQSPFLFCAAAGSDGSDNTYNGIHLRWDLAKELGHNHIPKGDLAATTSGYNQSNDYVSLYRTTFNLENETIKVDFSTLDESNINYLPDDEGFVYYHHYAGIDNYIIVRFDNKARFRQILDSGLDPGYPIQDFLSRYDGIIEVEVEGKLMFHYRIIFDPSNGSGDGWFETIGTTDRSDREAIEVVKREFKDYDTLTSVGVNTTADNIRCFRVKPIQMPAPTIMEFCTYEDFFTLKQDTDSWEEMGMFSLSLDEYQVFKWFQGDDWGGGDLQLDWPKYNEGVMLNGENYMDRWQYVDEGLKAIVEKFIDLSNSDPRAEINYETGDPEDPNTITVSLLDMLRMVSLDYHAARMLGLGFLDGSAYNYEDGQTRFVYAVVYATSHTLPGYDNGSDNVFMTTPTRIEDFRLPVAPLLNIDYGLYVSSDENNPPELVSHANGYSFHEDSRYINLHKINVNSPQPVLDFIPDEEFDATIITQPSAYGIEYKEQNESGWRSPEILQDDEYSDINGIPEATTVPEQDSNPVYTHRETEQGVHRYALYSVNIFSRISEIGQEAFTDQTIFSKKNTLLPPFNFSVQYIQEEDPLIFTTQMEQNFLEGLNNTNPNGDNYRTRVSFEWDNLHNNAYQSADKIEFYFREAPVAKVEGKILEVQSISETQCLVFTGSYTMASVNPAVIIQPIIPAGHESRFIGSLFNTAEGQFEIYSVAPPPGPGYGPRFFLKKIVSREGVQVGSDEPIIMMNVYQSPQINDVFFTYENVEDISQWVKLDRSVQLVNFSSQVETVYEEDGSFHNEHVGGINGNALIEEIPASDGGYTVTFNTGVNLLPHPDSSVDWVKGSARFKITGSIRKKKLAVFAIQQTSPVKIVVYDPAYLSEPGNRIQTGVLQVNFHPAYRVYLSPEPTKFDKPKIMPSQNVNNKKTYLVARSKDTSLNFSSSLSSPATLVARNIQKPMVPESILGPSFATRPDFFGKSTYTLDIKLNVTNRIPYGIVVYRANEMAVLQALYKPQTVQIIVTTLAGIAATDDFKFNRWTSLIEAETDSSDNNQFKLWGDYRFPNPDNDSTILFLSATQAIKPFPFATGTLLVNQIKIRQVIDDIFIPLTETPIVFEYLKPGYQTSANLPKVRDMIGRLLFPSDIAFDPFPMAAKYPTINPHTVRFTDYSLEGSARNIYFYFAREVASNTKLSIRTPVAGPIVLIDSAPAIRPKIRRVISREADTFLTLPPAVLFEIAEYISSENIKKYQIFRTLDIVDTVSVNRMTLAATIEVGEELVDEFTNLDFPPFGVPIFYRIVALREIVNENDVIEYVPSEPSETVVATVIDVLNPPAPNITPVIGGTILNGNGVITALTNVTLQWPTTAYNAEYSILKMNLKGNWEKLWTKRTNDTVIIFPENGDFVNFPEMANLPKLDEVGNTIYHRFIVKVENGSGLFNLEEKDLVI